jgi:hypothetical protein
MSYNKELRNLEIKTKEGLNELEDKLASKKISKSQYEQWKSKLEEYLVAIQKQIKTKPSEEYLSEARIKLYENYGIQKLLTHFIEGKIKKIIPVFDKEFGVCFPSSEKIMGTSLRETQEIIDKMVEANILVPEVHSKGLKCPRCRSNNVVIQYFCPFCQSADFDKSKVIEHFKCHYMDVELKFKKDKDLICPSCNSLLKQIGVDYQKHGPWFKCNGCQKLFDEPLSSYGCSDCGAIFELQQAVFVNLYSYVLNIDYQEEYESVTIPINELDEKLKNKNWIMRAPTFIIGVSGLIHQFFSAFWYSKTGDDVVLPIDPRIIMEVIVSNTAISSERVLNFSAKAQDVAAPIKLLVGISRFELKAEEIAETYGISLLTVSNRKDFADKIAQFIDSKVVLDKLDHIEEETTALEEALKIIDDKISTEKD